MNTFCTNKYETLSAAVTVKDSQSACVCGTKYLRYLTKTYVLHTRAVVEIAIHDSYKNVGEADPLKQIVQE